MVLRKLMVIRSIPDIAGHAGGLFGNICHNSSRYSHDVSYDKHKYLALTSVNRCATTTTTREFSNPLVSLRAIPSRAIAVSGRCIVIACLIASSPPIFAGGQIEDFIKATTLNRFADKMHESSDIDEVQQIQAPKGRLRFAAFGDSGIDQKPQFLVALALEERCQKQGGFDGILLLGDISYPNGVQSPNDKLWTTKLTNYYRNSQCLSHVPIYPVLGNHDYGGKPVAWIQRQAIDPLWRFPSRSWAAASENIVTLIGVDSQVPWFGGLSSVDVQRQTGGWRLALGHHPIISASKLGKRHQGGGLAGWYMKNAMCDNVDIYLSGHAHHIEHRKLADCGIDTFIAGSGGGNLQKVNTHDSAAEFVASSHGFLDILLTPEDFNIVAVNSQGEEIYQYSRQR